MSITYGIYFLSEDGKNIKVQILLLCFVINEHSASLTVKYHYYIEGHNFFIKHNLAHNLALRRSL